MQPNEHLLDLWGLEQGSARTFVQQRLAHFTIRCFSQPLQAPTHAATKLPRSYIASVKPGYPLKAVFDPFAARAKREGWLDDELPTVMTLKPRCPRRCANCSWGFPSETCQRSLSGSIPTRGGVCSTPRSRTRMLMLDVDEDEVFDLYVMWPGCRCCRQYAANG